MRHDHCVFRLYDELGTEQSAAALASDLEAFGITRARWATRYATFAAGFRGPVAADEATFESLLWRQLQLLHDHDRVRHSWDPRVSSNPNDPSFSFSVAGEAYFVVGLHAASSRSARRFAWPVLCFNAHEQFEELRQVGVFERMRSKVRARDRALHGRGNPTLSDFGITSEAGQYSGRHNEPGWRCPLHTAPPSPQA